MADDNQIRASLNALLADGWAYCKRPLVPYESWPASGRIVLERDEQALYTTYSVYTDSSDWPGDGYPVRWTRGRFKAVELFEIRAVPA